MDFQKYWDNVDSMLIIHFLYDDVESYETDTSDESDRPDNYTGRPECDESEDAGILDDLENLLEGDPWGNSDAKYNLWQSNIKL